VHNCLVDSGASSNVMSYSVCKKLNAEPQICKTKIIQLDRSNVKVIGELKDVLIHLASNSEVHQTIDIIVVDISEAYGVILSRDWSTKLNGYFATNWSHLWLSYKGQPNKIKVE
jgi:sporulation-control protein spo0M